MAQCRTFVFTCNIDTIGGVDTGLCQWTAICCNGEKTKITLDPNDVQEYCIEPYTLIQKQTTYGYHYEKLLPDGSGPFYCDYECGDVNTTPIPGYIYFEYENCLNPSVKQIFRAPETTTSVPNSVAYTSICWTNPVATSSLSNINLLSLPEYTDCTACNDAVNPAPTPTPAPTPVPSPEGIEEYCLTYNNTLNIVEADLTLQGFGIVRYYVFNGSYGVYNVNVGVYQIYNVPSEWPIAFLNNGVENLISYTGNANNLERTATALDGNTYDFYSGTVTLNVNGDFGAISYQTLYPLSTNGQYFGGQNNLRFTTECDIPDATPSPTPTPTPATPTPAPTSVVPPIPSPVKTNWTLSYSDNVQGWPSFYTYNPDYMIGMNNFFYTFYKGNLYQHNVNELRNNYYGQQYNSQITSVFNANPLENKIFKTLNLESDNAWESYLETDIQSNGFMEDGWFEKKEGSWFAYLRQEGQVPAFEGQYAMRSANGIGKTSSVSVNAGTTILNFSTNPLVSIGSIISVGDYVYHSLPQYTEITYGGIVTQINVDLRNGINQLIVSTTSDNTVAFPFNDPYIMFIKSSEAESHGLLGHYCLFTITNFNTNKTELFAVEAEVMKSYP